MVYLEKAPTMRIMTDEEWDSLMDAIHEDDAIAHWKNMFSWVNNLEFKDDFSFRTFYGFNSAKFWHYYYASFRNTHVGFRPAFAGLTADIQDGEVVVVGTLYMDGVPVHVPRKPTWDGDIEDYIPNTKLELRPAIDDTAYQVTAIKVGDIFIADRNLLKNISYRDIESNLATYLFTGAAPSDNSQKTTESIPARPKYLPTDTVNIMRITTDEEWNQLMDAVHESDAVTHWKGMLSWVNDHSYKKKASLRALRGCYSPRLWNYFIASYQDASVGFRPTFACRTTDTLPSDIKNGETVVVGTLYMDGAPVRIPQKPTWNGDIEDYIPNTKLELRPAIDDPAYQVTAIKVGDIFIADRNLLKNISFMEIEKALDV